MKRYAIILALMAIIVIGTRVTIAPGIRTKWEQENFWLKKANLNEEFDLVVLGDSRALYAVNPDLLLENGKGLNYSFRSMSYTERYLERAQGLVAKGSKILLALTTESLTSFESDKGLFDFIRRGPLFIHQTLKWTRVHWPQIGLHRLAQQKTFPNSYLFPRDIDETYHENGWIESTMPRSNTLGMIHHYRELARKFKLERKYIEGLAKKIHQWSSTGIDVSFFWICFEEEVCAEEAGILTQSIRKAIEEEFIASGARLLTWEGKFRTFDGDHLPAGEARRFSKQLAAAMKLQDYLPTASFQK